MLKMQEIYGVVTKVRRASRSTMTVTITVTNKRSGSSGTAFIKFDLKQLDGNVNEIVSEEESDGD